MDLTEQDQLREDIPDCACPLEPVLPQLQKRHDPEAPGRLACRCPTTSYRDAVSDDTWASLADKFVDEAYASVKGYVRTYVMHQQLLEHLPAPPAIVLDVGGGAGHQSFPLAQAGYDVTLLDSSPAMLDKARERLERLPAEAQRRVTLLEADGENADEAVEGRRFAAVLCHGVLGYLEQPEPLVDQLCRCAAAGGIVSIMTGNAKATAVQPALEQRWDDALASFDARTGDRGARRAGPSRHGGGTQRAVAQPRRGATALVRGVAVRRLARVQWSRVGPRRRQAGSGDGRGRTRSQPADPYRQLSRVFHLVGRKGLS